MTCESIRRAVCAAPPSLLDSVCRSRRPGERIDEGNVAALQGATTQTFRKCRFAVSMSIRGFIG